MRDTFTEGALLDGRYKTLQPLNHGSFGMVFMAQDLQTQAMVAVKCLTKPAAAGSCPSGISVDDRSEELVCHAKLASHPNVVNMLHHFETDAHLYLVLEFCAMGDLYEAIRSERGPRETDNVRDFMLQLVDAVEYMHARGYAHRDIKPENVFLTLSGHVKLGDFGLATAARWTHESAVGSDRYMAPEQYDSAGHGYSPVKADVWAIGICLINLIFSRNPFVTPTQSDPLFADYTRDNQALFDIFPTMSQDTFEVLNYAMAMDPEKRSLAAVREALLRVISFTTVDESLDDFCTEDREMVPPSANREPLRTPSVQSPTIDHGAFPWARALGMSEPQHVRQLSMIPDTEEYDQDLAFGSCTDPEGEEHSSVAEGPGSMASVLDSGLGASLKSLAIPRAGARTTLRGSDPLPIFGSMPTMSSKMTPSVFGAAPQRSEDVAKSWSDLWDEDVEERVQQPMLLRTPSAPLTPTIKSDEYETDVTIRAIDMVTANASERTSVTSTVRGRRSAEILRFRRDSAKEDDLFVFEEPCPPRDRSPPPAQPRYTPPSRRDIMDKWAALGNRRRAYNTRAGAALPAPPTGYRSLSGGMHGPVGLDARYGQIISGPGFTGSHGGVWEGFLKNVRLIGNAVDGTRRGGPDGAGVVHVHGEDGAGDSEWVGGWHHLHL